MWMTLVRARMESSQSRVCRLLNLIFKVQAIKVPYAAATGSYSSSMGIHNCISSQGHACDLYRNVIDVGRGRQLNCPLTGYLYVVVVFQVIPG